jgi:hypothetical protein
MYANGYVEEPNPIREKISSIFDGLMNSGKTKIDTTISFHELFSEADSIQVDEKLKNCFFNIHVDTVKEEMWFDIVFNYKDENEVRSMMKSFQKISEKSGKASANPRLYQYNFHHDLKNKTIVSDAINLYEYGTFKSEDMTMFESMKEDELNMFLEMVGMKVIETIIYLPGKFKSILGIQYMQLDDTTIVIKQNTADYIKTGDIPRFEIKYE